MRETAWAISGNTLKRPFSITVRKEVLALFRQGGLGN
jgi:hypothetical protein